MSSGYATKLTYGISTQPQGRTLASYPMPSPVRSSSNPLTDPINQTNWYAVATYYTDFFVKDNGWTVTGTSSTLATSDALGGVGVITPGGSGTATAAYQASAGFQFIAGQKLWFETNFKCSAVASATQILSMGLIASSGGTVSTNNSLLIKKAAGSTSLSLVSTVGGTATTLVSNLATITSGTALDVGFVYNGTDLEIFIADQLAARVASPTIGSSATTLTNSVMTPYFAITPVTTETLSLDFVVAAQEIQR